MHVWHLKYFHDAIIQRPFLDRRFVRSMSFSIDLGICVDSALCLSNTKKKISKVDYNTNAGDDVAIRFRSLCVFVFRFIFTSYFEYLMVR